MNCEVGHNQPHWHGTPFKAHLKTEQTGRYVLALKPMKILEAFVRGEIDFDGNIYLISAVRNYAKLDMSKWEFLLQLISNSAFQDMAKAKVNVKSHYDIPQEVLNRYLDQTYMSYSCGMFEDPENLVKEEMIIAGKGQEDTFDSLEKAQWRKYKDAVDFLAPAEGETMLDVGCGYGGQLVVALENHPFGKVVGWTHSNNQVTEGKKMLSHFDEQRWELKEGDYREEPRQFDHITSTGMISHVGPRGLIPYVKNS